MADVNGDGYLDENEVESLFQKEVMYLTKTSQTSHCQMDIMHKTSGMDCVSACLFS